LYTIQTNYLFDKYPPKKIANDRSEIRIDIPVNDESIQEYTQVYTSVLGVEDEHSLKDEIAYLREENKGLRVENKELKLLPAPQNVTQGASMKLRKHSGSGFGVNSITISSSHFDVITFMFYLD
jgi:mevalonate kinase